MTFTDDAVKAVLYGTDPTDIETSEAAVGSEQTVVWNAPAGSTPTLSTYDVLPANDFDLLNATTGTFFISLADLRLALGDPDLRATSQQRSNTQVIVQTGHGKVLRQVLPANYYSYAGGAGAYYFAALPDFDDPIDEARLKFDMRIHSGGGIDWGKAAKLPGLGGINDLIDPDQVTGSNGANKNGWSSRLGWNTATANPPGTVSPAELIGYRYWPDQPLDWGSTLHTNAALDDGWHTVEQYIKMNDVGTANGVHQIVLDGVTVYSSTSVEWRVRDDVHITHLFWHVYRGGDKAGVDASDYGVTDQTLVDFDNLQIIGYNGGATPASTVWTSDLLTWTTGSTFLTRVEIRDAAETALASLDVGEFASSSYSATLLYDSSDGSVVIAGTEIVTNTDMTIEVLDDDLVRAPTAVTVTLSGGFPASDVDFSIDGTFIRTLYTDEDGSIAPSSIEVPEPFGAGSHTITASQSGSNDATAVFSLRFDPTLAEVAIGQDAMPVQIDGTLRSNGTRRWVLQDLLPGGLGSWIMTRNPAAMTPPYVDNALNSKHTTARSGGRFHITQGGTIPKDWSFSGEIFSEEEYLQLEAYRNLDRRFYVIDHRNRAWICVVNDITWTNKLQTNFGDLSGGAQTDWAADYEAQLTCFDQDWRTPQ